MRDAAGECGTEFAQDGVRKSLVSVALMQKDRLANIRRQFELPLETRELRWSRGEKIAEVIEAAFADRNDLRVIAQAPSSSASAVSSRSEA